MKIIITESQLKFIEEQVLDSDFGMNPNMNLAYERINSQILKVMAPFIPIVGPAISMGLIGYDMKKAYDAAKTNQDKSNVILSYVITMALSWGLGKVFSTMTELGEQGMKQLGRKLRTVDGWKMLSSKEGAVVLNFVESPKLWQDKLKSIVK